MFLECHDVVPRDAFIVNARALGAELRHPRAGELGVHLRPVAMGDLPQLLHRVLGEGRISGLWQSGSTVSTAVNDTQRARTAIRPVSASRAQSYHPRRRTLAELHEVRRWNAGSR